MDSALEDSFVVYVRSDHGHDATPEAAEMPLAACPSYEEARRLRRTHLNRATDCVIRYVGEAGGGD